MPDRIRWTVTPLVGLGPIALGAARAATTDVLAREGLAPRPQAKPSNKDEFLDAALQLHYEGGKLRAIECYADERLEVVYEGTDLLRAPALAVVDLLRRVAPFDADDPELGYTYCFPDLAVGLWRPTVPESDDDPEGRTFQSVTIAVAGYY